MRHTRLMATRHSVLMALQFAKALVVVPFLLPGQVLALRFVQNVFSYAVRAHVGIFAAYSFFVPRERAAGRLDEVEKYESLAWKTAWVVAAICASAGVVVALTSIAPWAAWVLAPWGAFAALMAFLQAALPARGEFPKLAALEIAHAAGGLLFPVAGVLLGGLSGLLIGNALCVAVVVAIARPWRWVARVHVPGVFARAALLQGFHLWTSGTLQIVATSVEVTLLATMLGAQNAFGGQYVVATLLAGIVGGVMSGAHQVMMPRVVRQLTQAPGDRPHALQRVNEASILELQIFLCGSAALLTGMHVIAWCFPTYTPALFMVGPLLVGQLGTRARMHLNVFFRFHEQHAPIHLGHAVHLAIVLLLGASLLVSGHLAGVVYVQAIGALTGTTCVTVVFCRALAGANPLPSIMRQTILTALCAGWLLLHTFGKNPAADAAVALGGGAALLLASFVMFPGSAGQFRRLIGARGTRSVRGGP